MRNPIKLMIYGTPECPRTIRTLYYFAYIFFVYAIAGQLVLSVPFFLVAAILGAFFGIFVNVL